MVHRAHLLAAVGIAVVVAGPARAQTITAGGGFERAVEHYSGDPALNRLDGSAVGWFAGGGVSFGPVVARVEAWRHGAIDDSESTTLVAAGRPVTIHSTLTHEARAWSALGGVTFDASGRVGITGLAGVSRVTIDRTFTTDAAQAILSSPSTIPATPVVVRMQDDFSTWCVGVDGSFRVFQRVRLTAGVRAERLRLSSDITGIELRVLAGAVVVLR